MAAFVQALQLNCGGIEEKMEVAAMNTKQMTHLRISMLWLVRRRQRLTLVSAVCELVKYEVELIFSLLGDIHDCTMTI